MNEKEKFSRFKNLLLSPSFLNDSNFFAEILGKEDFIFWDHIQEKAPYLPQVIRLDDTTKGQIILERIEIEVSPKRTADLLQGVYDTLAFYSMTPQGEADGMWQRYVGELSGAIQAAEFTDMRVRWIEEPEPHFTPKPIVERYYFPGKLEITYVGQNWGEVESQKIIESGFPSRILKEVHAYKKTEQENKGMRQPEKWWEKNWIQAIILLSALTSIIGFLLSK